MTTLLIAEHEHAVLKDSTNKALTAATQLGAEVHILVAGGGEGTKVAAEAAARLAGVKKVLVPKVSFPRLPQWKKPFLVLEDPKVIPDENACTLARMQFMNAIVPLDELAEANMTQLSTVPFPPSLICWT